MLLILSLPTTFALGMWLMVTAPLAEVLNRTSNEALLRAFAALTHRMHASADRDLRQQRDIVQGEILRRMR